MNKKFNVGFIQSTNSKSRNKVAFTLAEVLITLGIIGVVAAMTLPALIQNYKKQQATVRIKKFVSVINQALLAAENDIGPREDWESANGSIEGNLATSEFFINTYIKPYVKNLGVENTIKDDTHVNNRTAIVFSDGSIMSIKTGACYDIYYDINGEKGPNQQGRDVFLFILCLKKGDCNVESNQVRAFYCAATGTPFPTHEQIINNCKDNRIQCTILLEQNSYEFPKDYPVRL